MSIADKLTYLNETKRQLREAINAAFGAGLTESDSFRSYADFLYGLWTPELLFADGEQGAWYDPSDLSTLFQDAAGTTPVTADGDPVGLMLDKSGNGNHVVQDIASMRPTLKTDGALYWLDFDGVDDLLEAVDTNEIPAEFALFFAGESAVNSDGGSSALPIFGWNVLAAASFIRSAAFGLRPNLGATSSHSLRVRDAGGQIGIFFTPTLNKTYPFVVHGSVSGSPTIMQSSWNEHDIITEVLDRTYAPAYTEKIGVRGQDQQLTFRGGVLLNGLLSPEDVYATKMYLARKSGVTLL